MAETLAKEERLSGKTAISRLLSEGHWGQCGHIRYCGLKREGEELNRILVTVPKKFFKRAVKRNLLKRRMREAYRTQKELLCSKGMDMMFSYSSFEVAPYEEIRSDIARILGRSGNNED